ncbi:phage portal protein [Brucella sp. TWI432]
MTEDTNGKMRVRVPAGSRHIEPQAAYFKNERSPFFTSWRPQLREQYIDVQNSWTKAAARAIDSVQNSGFVGNGVSVSTGSVVGEGLKLAARPDGDTLGWDRDKAGEWGRKVEGKFYLWANNPLECDAGGKMTFGMHQQAAYASYLTFGEILSLLPLIKHKHAKSMTKVMLIPPSRIEDKSDVENGVYQGVKVDEWGNPTSYFIRRKPDGVGMESSVEIQARDADGRRNLLHLFDPAISSARGISPLANVLKIVRQVDQYADATLTSALIQTIFAATLKTDIKGISAFDGLFTREDRKGKVSDYNLSDLAGARGDWYDGASIDLTQHGRIAHLFPNDELQFTEAKQPGQQYDHFMGWLMREIAAGFGVSYETLTGDYRGATYSSVRMAGATEWLSVIRRRNNIIIPFCQSVYETWLDEEIFQGRIEFPGGYEAFLANKEAACVASWSGPARPQADEFKTARAFQVLKDMGTTTLSEICAAYGQDWDDVARQQKAENDYFAKLGLPLPWRNLEQEALDKERDDEELGLKDLGDSAGEKKDKGSGRKKNRNGDDRTGENPDRNEEE